MILKRNKSTSPRLFNIVEELTDGFCTINNHGEFIYVNLAAKTLMRLGDNYDYNFFDDIIRDENLSEYIRKYLEENEYIKDFEIELYSSENNKFPALISVNNIKDPSSNSIGMSVLIKDMTYIKQVQQQLLQAQKMESIGMLASGVAHEFNNILTGIIPNAELIKITTLVTDANHLRAKSIQKSANRASDIVKKLLNFARSEENQDEKTTDFIKTANETIEILRKLFDRKIELVINIPNNLYYAKVDGTSIQQIIMNLSINAKDAIEGSGKISFFAENIIIKSNRNQNKTKLKPGKYIKFQITDTGQGIDEEKLRYIFDPFYTTKKPGEGTGLGLSMVYGILKGSDGHIEVDSQVGIGTTFTIYFPATSKASKKEVSEFQQSYIGRGHSILVIDDEEIIAEMAKDMMQSLGFKVFTAINGSKGLELYKNNIENIDVILLDLLMPEMDGTTCFKYLKMINPDVKVIISSGMGEQSKKIELENMGISGYLEKPYSLKSISQILEKVLN